MKVMIFLTIFFGSTVFANVDIDAKVLAVCSLGTEVVSEGSVIKYTFYKDKNPNKPKAGFVVVSDEGPSQGLFSDYNSLNSIPVFYDPKSEGIVVLFDGEEVKMERNWDKKIVTFEDGSVMSCSTGNF